MISGRCGPSGTLYRFSVGSILVAPHIDIDIPLLGKASLNQNPQTFQPPHHQLEMPSTRPLIIPQKRALLPPRTNSSTPQTQPRTYQILNPSAVAAETCMKAARVPETADEPASHLDRADDGPSRNLTRIEFDFAAPPQPFLDPPVWEAMLKRARARSLGVEGRAGGVGEGGELQGGAGSANTGSETPREQRGRVGREAEYNSIAIRGRSSISARGKRARGVGRGGSSSSYWGGRQ